MKRELNLQKDTHMDLLQEMAFISLTGTKVREIKELRFTFEQDKNEYFNSLKLKYVVLLGLLGLEYKISCEVEYTLFSYIDYLIREIIYDSLDDDDQLSFIQS